MKNTPTDFSVPNGHPQNVHAIPLEKIEQVILRNIYVYTYAYMRIVIMRKEVMDLKLSKNRYVGRFGGRKGKGKM